jgi:phosphoglycolate phosphatase
MTENPWEPMMPIRAALFDFDGTLADSFAAITASTNHVRTSFGLPAMTEAEVRRYVGHGLRNLMVELAPGFDADEAVRRYREHHPTVMASGTRLFPGVADTVRDLHRRGVKLGVCSNKAVPFTRALVRGLGLGECMAEVLGPEDAGGKPKPDPTMLLEACRRLGVPPVETVYVGDMIVDVQAGKAAGIPVWLVHIGEAGDEDPRTAGPDRVLAEFAELKGLIV